MAQTIVKIIIPIVLGVIMLAMGLGLTIDDFKRVLEKPKAVAVGSFAQLVLLPAAGFLFAYGFGLSMEMAVGLVLVTCSPGGPSSNLFTHLGRGDVALSVTLTAVSGAVTILTVPFIVNLALSTFSGDVTPREIPVLLTNLQILAVVGFPVMTGMLIRSKNAAFADKLESILKKVSVVLLVLLIIGAVAKEHARVLEYFAEAGPVVIALNCTTMLFGFLLAKILRLNRAQSVTVTLEVGMQNAAMAITIAMSLLNSDAMAIPGVIYGLWMYATCALVVVYGRMGTQPE